MLDCDSSWQAQHGVKWGDNWSAKCWTSPCKMCLAGVSFAISRSDHVLLFGHVGVSLLVAGAILSDVGVVMLQCVTFPCRGDIS